MVPVNLKLTNFRSFGPTTNIPLDFASVFCIVGPNGAGKSTIIEAMLWALFGVSREGRQKWTNVMRKGARFVEVEFEFRIENEGYKVIRRYDGRKHLDVFRLSNGRRYSLTTSRRLSDAQRKLEELLGTNYDGLVSASVFVQNEAGRFSKLTPSRRRELLAKLFGIEVFQKIRDRASLRVRELSAVRTANQHELEGINEQLSQIPDPTDEIAIIEKELEHTKSKIDEKLAELGKAQERKAFIQARIENLNKKKDELLSIKTEIENLIKEQEKLRLKASQLKSILSNESEIREQFESLKKLQDEESKLSEKLAHQTYLQERLGELQQRLSKLQKDKARQIGMLSGKIKQLRNFLIQTGEELESYDSLSAVAKKFEDAKKLVATLEQKKAEYDKISSAISSVRMRIDAEREAIMSQIKTLEQEISELMTETSKMGMLKTELEKVKQKLMHAKNIQKRIDELEGENAQAKLRIQTLEQAKAELSSRIRKVSEQLTFLFESDVPRCPLCGSELTYEHKNEVTKQLESEKQKLTEKLNNTKKEIEKIKEQLVKTEHELENLNRKKPDENALEDERKRLEAELARLSQVELEIKRRSEKLVNLKEKIATDAYAQKWRDELKNLERNLLEIDFSHESFLEAKSMLDELEPKYIKFQELRRLQQQSKTTKAELEKLKKQLEELKSAEVGAQISQQIEKITSELDALGYDRNRHLQVRKRIATLEPIKKKMYELEQAKKNLPEAMEAIERVKSQISEKRKRLKHVSEEISNIELLKRELNKLEAYSDAVNKRVEELRRRKDELSERLTKLVSIKSVREELLKRKARLRSVISDTGSKEKIYSALAEICGPLGIQDWLLRRYLSAIESDANDILGLLTDGELSVRLVPEGTEKLAVRISDHLGERPYESYSGGEEFRIDFALRLALSRTLAQRSGFPLRTLIIDEGFGSQDEQGLQKLIDAIFDVSSEFEKIIVISHLPQLKNSFPARLEVEKTAEGSKVRVFA